MTQRVIERSTLGISREHIEREVIRESEVKRSDGWDRGIPEAVVLLCRTLLGTLITGEPVQLSSDIKESQKLPLERPLRLWEDGIVEQFGPREEG